MKFNLKLLAPAAALLLASTASADVTLYITGSTAFRSGTVTAIKNIMTFGGGQGYAFTGSSFTGANQHVFVGSVTGITGTVTVKTSWNGAVAGVKALNNNTTANYLVYPATTGTAYTLSASGTGSVNANNVTESSTADIAMFDNLQSSTKYTGTSLTQTKVGIIPFAWVASPSAPAGLTNMTPQLARNLFSTGYSSAALFTNNPADADDQVGGTRIYAAGRDPLSGTRLVTFAESSIGIFTAVAQYQPATIARSAVNGISGNTITDIELTAADAAVDAPNDGENGYSSGGNLADLARYTTASVTDQNSGFNGKVAFVTYLGESDANRAVNGTGSSVTGGNAKYLSYNGVSAFGGLAKSFAECTITSGSAVVSFPATTVNGTPTAQSTTGLQAGQLIRSNNFPGDTIIVSVDSATQITLSKNATSSNGTTSGQPNGALSTSVINPASIWNGSYTFWGYEYIAWRQSLAGDKLIFGGKLRDQIINVDYFAAGLSILPSSSGGKMRVQRGTDGGTVSQNY